MVERAKKTAAKKAPAKKAAGTRTRNTRKRTGKADDDIVNRYDLTTHLIPLDELKLYPGNPNVGGAEEAINESLRETGLYMPLRVQKSTKYILGGNHTYEELLKLGATAAWCILLDVDDKEAKRIVIGDNNIGSLANIDKRLQAELMVSIGDTVGTGFRPEDMDLFDRVARDAVADLEDLVGDGEEGMLSRIHRETLGGIDTPDSEDEDEESYGADGESIDADDEVTLDDAGDEIEGMFALKSDMIFDSKHPMGYPPLRPDMMMEELPGDVDSWAGSATRDDPRMDDTENPVWWVYNYGIDSTSGMKDLSKMILSFYAWDDYFESWWSDPAKYVSRMLNSGVKYAITPNWSMFPDDAAVCAYYNLYRSRWLGRFMQEAGIRVMPDLQWFEQDPRAEETIRKHTSYGLPKGLKWGSLQCQTNSDNLKDKKVRKKAADEYVFALDYMEVENVLVYAGPPGRELWTEDVIPRLTGTKVKMIRTRNEKLAESRKGKGNKTTL